MFGLRLGKLGAAIKAGTGSAGVVPLFSRDYTQGTLGANATFARSSSATIVDHEGVIRTVPSGAARFNGLRYVRNLITLSSENLQVGWGARNGAVITGQDSVTFGAVHNSRLDRSFILPACSQKIIYRVDVKADDAGSVGKEFVLQAISGATGGYSTLGLTSYTLTDTYSTIAISFTSHVSDFTVIPLLRCNELTTVKVNITNVQIENVTGQTNQNPSEYVSVGVLSAPYHGANVDGVKYFTTENGNTVTDNVVTEGTGAAITGGYLLMEPAATNRCDYSEALDNAAWAKSNCTITANSIASPAGATTADTLTATAANASCLDSITLASSTVRFSVYLKRKTGTGNIDLTVDGGSTWTTKAITSEWARYDITQAAVTNPNVGIRIVTSGDEVYAWGAQLTQQSAISSYIPTSGSAVTRAAESLSYSGAWTADNETRAITDAGTVDVDDWDGVVDATINGADNLAQISSITVYTTGERPA